MRERKNGKREMLKYAKYKEKYALYAQNKI